MFPAEGKYPSQASAQPVAAGDRKGDVAGNGKLNLGSGGGAAPDTELGADLFGSLAHAHQSPVPFASRLQYLRVDTAAVVTHQNAKAGGGVFQLHFDVFRVRMPKSIHQGFAADAVHFVTQHGMQRLRFALNDDTKSNAGDVDLVANFCKSLGEIRGGVG